LFFSFSNSSVGSSTFSIVGVSPDFSSGFGASSGFSSSEFPSGSSSEGLFSGSSPELPSLLSSTSAPSSLGGSSCLGADASISFESCSNSSNSFF